MGAARFRKIFNIYLVLMGLSSRLFKPYSLRRGGATHLFHISGAYSVVEAKGRWASSRTAKLYIDESRTELAKVKPAVQTRRFDAAGVRLYRAFLKRLCQTSTLLPSGRVPWGTTRYLHGQGPNLKAIKFSSSPKPSLGGETRPEMKAFISEGPQADAYLYQKGVPEDGSTINCMRTLLKMFRTCSFSDGNRPAVGIPSGLVRRPRALGVQSASMYHAFLSDCIKPAK